jgi:hypothetical protein
MNEIIDVVILIALCCLCVMTGFQIYLMGYQQGIRQTIQTITISHLMSERNDDDAR